MRSFLSLSAAILAVLCIYVHPTTCQSTSPGNSSSCGKCYEVVTLSAVAVADIPVVDPTITKSLASRTTVTTTVPIATLTMDTLDQFSGILLNVSEVLLAKAPYRFSPTVLSVVSTIMDLQYQSQQEFWSAGACYVRTEVLTLTATATISSDAFPSIAPYAITPMAVGSAPSTMLDLLGQITCTQVVVTPTKTMATVPSYTMTADLDFGSEDVFPSSPQLSQARKLGIGVSFGSGIGVIIGVLAFYIWRHSQKTGIVNKPYRHRVSWLSGSKVGDTELQRNSWRAAIVHLEAPLTMFAGLLVGMAFAIGHHYLYFNVAGISIDEVKVSQSWMIRAGTLIAILAKISLGVSVRTAFVQLQWSKTRQQAFRIKDINAISGGLDNLLCFAHKIWWYFPSLSWIALICWLLFFIPVITPGTLTVQSLAFRENVSLAAPELNLENFREDWGDEPGSVLGGRSFIRASSILTRIFLPAAIGGQVPALLPQYSNQTFNLNFYGPAVNCTKANDSTVLDFTSRYGGGPYRGAPSYTLYYSWVGNDDWNNDPALNMIGGNWPHSLDLASRDTSRLYIMYSNSLDGYNKPTVKINGTVFWLADITECSLYNASYNVDFFYRNSEQNVRFTNVSFVNNVASLPDGGEDDKTFAYLSLMSALGSLFVGTIESDPGELAGSSDTEQGTWTQISLLPKIQRNTIAQDVEELFRNMTISVLTSYNNTLNTNTAVVGSMIQYRTTYIYDSTDLILTYSLAFFFAFLCSAIGCYCFVLNNGSYQNTFSTFIRATKKCNLPIEESDDGVEPCPSSLAHTMVHLVQHTSPFIIPRVAEESIMEDIPLPPNPSYTRTVPQNLSYRRPVHQSIVQKARGNYQSVTTSITSSPVLSPLVQQNTD